MASLKQLKEDEFCTVPTDIKFTDFTFKFSVQHVKKPRGVRHGGHLSGKHQEAAHKNARKIKKRGRDLELLKIPPFFYEYVTRKQHKLRHTHIKSKRSNNGIYTKKCLEHRC
jgi:hypothetical protein